MRFLLAAVLAVTAALPVVAQDQDQTELTKLQTANDARGWEAVGRLNIGRAGMCTGALIAPDVVLTAGHCLYDTRTGQQVDPTTVEFLAGWRNGRASATRKVRSAVVHPDYVYSGPTGSDTVAVDLAILKLASPINRPQIQPFATGKRPRKGASVGVVSYARDRADSPSIQKVCHVLARRQGMLILSCDADFGSSGAPIFAEVDGEPQIVSVVSSIATIRDRPVSFGTNLEKPLAEMLALLNTNGGTIAPPPTAVVRTKPNTPRVLSSGGGAKFLKP
ncbi:S1 family peptidase [Rhodobacteraceae bacterium]|nr:S1 family peptidase [Paracoccaceae bacterium]